MLVWNRPALLFISLRLAAGAMGHGPEMFQTFNQQHNPLQKFGKIAKTYGALRQGLRWAPMGPMGQPLKKTTTHAWSLFSSPDINYEPFLDPSKRVRTFFDSSTFHTCTNV